MWTTFLSELEESYETEAIIQYECKGAFLTFRSKLVDVERPGAFSVETMHRFGVVPHHVTLTFANGVRLNIYTKHVQEVERRGNGIIISFRSDGRSKNSVALFPVEHRKRYTG